MNSLLQLFQDEKYVKICAPMVRYSKLPFRQVTREYGVDIAYTPMILADVFRNSEIARNMEFESCALDNPVIVQFAANDADTLADAAELIAPYVSGVDINCGCPQKWAIHEGIGAAIMSKPELVCEMISKVKQRIDKPCSVKIRVHKDLKETVEYAKRAEKAGADWITVHGRTRFQNSSEPVNLESIKLVKDSVSIPVVANGDVFTLEDADRIVQETRVNGVMAARGLLDNPALFAGYSDTPLECVRRFVQLSLGYGTNFFIFHHHLMHMLSSQMTRTEKKRFNHLTSVASVLDYLSENYGISFN